MSLSETPDAALRTRRPAARWPLVARLLLAAAGGLLFPDSTSAAEDVLLVNRDCLRQAVILELSKNVANCGYAGQPDWCAVGVPYERREELVYAASLQNGNKDHGAAMQLYHDLLPRHLECLNTLRRAEGIADGDAGRARQETQGQEIRALKREVCLLKRALVGVQAQLDQAPGPQRTVTPPPCPGD